MTSSYAFDGLGSVVGFISPAGVQSARPSYSWAVSSLYRLEGLSEPPVVTGAGEDLDPESTAVDDRLGIGSADTSSGIPSHHTTVRPALCMCSRVSGETPHCVLLIHPLSGGFASRGCTFFTLAGETGCTDPHVAWLVAADEATKHAVVDGEVDKVEVRAILNNVAQRHPSLFGGTPAGSASL